MKWDSQPQATDLTGQLLNYTLGCHWYFHYHLAYGFLSVVIFHWGWESSDLC